MLFFCIKFLCLQGTASPPQHMFTEGHILFIPLSVLLIIQIHYLFYRLCVTTDWKLVKLELNSLKSSKDGKD